MKLLYLFFLYFISSVSAQEVNFSFLKDNHHKIEGSFKSIQESLDDFFTRNENTSLPLGADYQIARIDLGFSLSAEMGLTLFSVEKEKSLELIWERKGGESSSNTSKRYLEEEVILTSNHEDNYKAMMGPVLKALEASGASGKIKRKVLRKVYQDASKLTKKVKAISSFPETYGWRVNKIFKNYYFSARGDLIFNDISYDKRLRFGFYTPQIMKPSYTRFERRIHRRLKHQLSKVENVRKLDPPFSNFKLDRVLLIDSMELGLDAKFLKLTKAKGIQIELVHDRQSLVPEAPLITGVSLPHYYATRGIVNIFENNLTETKLSLSQIRFKGELSKNLDLIFASLSKIKNIEYHYRTSL